MRWSPCDRNTLVSYSNDQTIRIWNPHSMPQYRLSFKQLLPNNIVDISWQKNIKYLNSNSANPNTITNDNKNFNK